MDEQRTFDDVMAKLLGPAPSHQCTAHSRSGEQCLRGPVEGTTVCAMHGGKIPAVAAKAELRTVERAAVMEARRGVLELTDRELVELYGNPGETLQWIMAVSRAMASRLHAALADHPDLTYFDMFGNPHVRPEVGALLKAADQAGSHAERALRLGLDQRGLDLQERQIALLDRALDNALAQAGIGAEAQRTIRTVLRAEILAADDAQDAVTG